MSAVTSEFELVENRVVRPQSPIVEKKDASPSRQILLQQARWKRRLMKELRESVRRSCCSCRVIAPITLGLERPDEAAVFPYARNLYKQMYER